MTNLITTKLYKYDKIPFLSLHRQGYPAWNRDSWHYLCCTWGCWSHRCVKRAGRQAGEWVPPTGQNKRAGILNTCLPITVCVYVSPNTRTIKSPPLFIGGTPYSGATWGWVVYSGYTLKKLPVINSVITTVTSKASTASVYNFLHGLKQVELNSWSTGDFWHYELFL